MTGKTRSFFESAEQAYDEAISLIQELDELFQARAFREDPDARYDTRVTLYQFDVILQAMLLSAALSDGDFHRLEKRMIQKITDYGDLLTYLRQEHAEATELAWDKIARMDDHTQEILVEKLPVILDETCRSFVLPLARAEGTEHAGQFLERLESQLAKIGTALGYLDGNREDRETDAFNEMLKHLLVEHWERIRVEN